MMSSCLQRVAFLPDRGSEEQVSWVTLETAEAQSDIDWQILTFTPPPEQENSQYRKGLVLLGLIKTNAFEFFFSETFISQ